MDTIINGILRTPHPDPVKLALVDQIFRLRKDKPVDDTNDILKYASDLALNRRKLERDIAAKILQNMAAINASGFNEFFKSQSLLSYVSNTYQNPITISPTIAFLHQVLKLKADTQSPIDGAQLRPIVIWLISQFKAASNVELQENICTMLLYLRNAPEFSFVAQKAQTMLQVVVTWLCTTDFINTGPTEYNKHVTILVEFMLLLWNNFSAHLVLETLNHVFVRVSSPLFPSPPSPAVANVLHCAPSSLIWAAAPHITANAAIKDPQLELALSRIVKWPLTMNTARWVVGLLQGLIEAKKFTVLARITIKSVEPVLNQVWIERTSRGALHVLEHMLLGFQHAPDAFHLVVPLLAPLLHYLSRCAKKQKEVNDLGSQTTSDYDDPKKVVEHAVVMHLAVPSPLPPPPTLSSPPSSDASLALTTTPLPIDSSTPATSSPQLTTPDSQLATPAPQVATPDPQSIAASPQPSTSSLQPSTPSPQPSTPQSTTQPSTPQPQPSTTPQPSTAQPPTTQPSTTPQSPTPTPAHTIFLTASSPLCVPVLDQLGRLVWVLLAHHMGHPELYAPLVSELTNADISLPPDDETKAILLERAWTSLKDVKVDSEIKGRAAGSKGGLFNLGNTCYQNSMLQTLFMTDQLRARILSLPPLTPKNPLPREFQRLFAFLSSSLRDAWDPTALYKVYPEWYRSGLQQDSCEFGKYLLDQLDTELKGVTAPISSIFEGRMLQTITCSVCKSHSSVVETFWDLPLAFAGDVNKQESVDGMLESFFLPETLEGSNQYSCSTCKQLRNAEKSLCILDPPPSHLMLTLKRFAYDPGLKKQVKILKEIRYPEVITLPYDIIPEYSSDKKKLENNPQNNTNPTNVNTTSNSTNNTTNNDSTEKDTINTTTNNIPTNTTTTNITTNNATNTPTNNTTTTNNSTIDNITYVNNNSNATNNIANDTTNNITNNATNNTTNNNTINNNTINNNTTNNIHLDNEKGNPESSDTTNMEIDAQPPTKKTKVTHQQATYILYGVIMHSGTSAERGHYYAYARSSKEASQLSLPSSAHSSTSPPSPSSSSNSSGKKQEEGWLMFNDSQVRPSSFESFTSITKTFRTDVAYILFYVRVGTNEDPDKPAPLSIPAHLQSEIVADNKKFLEELEGQQKRAAQRQVPYFSSFSGSRPPYDDDENNNGGFGGGGGGGGGFGGFGGGLGGGRVVF